MPGDNMSSEDIKSLPKVQTRKEYMDTLADMNSPPKRPRSGDGPRGRITELKAYLVETNEIFKSGNGNKVTWELTDTGVDEVKILCVRDTKKQSPVRQFYLDKVDKRFLLLHTDELAEDANDAIEKMVEDYNHTFDHTWFYSGLMKKWAGNVDGDFGGYLINYGGMLYEGDSTLKMDITGTNAKMIYDMLPKSNDAKRLLSHEAIEMCRGSKKTPSTYIEERIANTGYFSIKHGKSIQDHLHMVNNCKDEYAKLITRVEKYGMGEQTINDAKFYGGKPIIITYPKIQKLEQFIDTMFNARKPFKLWGIKVKRKDFQYSVPAVDLHEGSAINFEITPEAMRIYLNKGSCGNTIMRLFTNLQIHYDARTKCDDLE